jgi:hypothetical protein
MVFYKTKKNFAQNYNHIKNNTTLIERKVKDSVNTGLVMLDALESDAKNVYRNVSSRVNKIPYYKTMRNYIMKKNGRKNSTTKRYNKHHRVRKWNKNRR